MPRQRITKEMVVEAAFSLAREGGMEKVLVKNIAERIGGSAQPVYCYCRNMDGLSFVSGQSTIKGREVRTTPSVKSLDIRLHGFIIRDAISITMSIGLTMDWANKKD